MGGKKELAEAVTSNGQQNQEPETAAGSGASFYDYDIHPALKVKFRYPQSTQQEPINCMHKTAKRLWRRLLAPPFFSCARRGPPYTGARIHGPSGCTFLDRARALDVETVQISDPETHKVYTTDARKLLDPRRGALHHRITTRPKPEFLDCERWTPIAWRPST